MFSFSKGLLRNVVVKASRKFFLGRIKYGRFIHALNFCKSFKFI